ncbi:MAG: hypothetical protein IJK64_00840 [Clostridia bacterium]|nr:hypothetical protein [Clostridia bacterium]
MLNLLPYYMVRNLLLTVAIETALAALLGLRRRDLLYVALANVMTNPLVNVSTFLAGFFGGAKVRLWVLIAVELAAFGSEGFVYYKTLEKRRPHPFLLSLLCNAASYGAGLAINAIFH